MPEQVQPPLKQVRQADISGLSSRYGRRIYLLSSRYGRRIYLAGRWIYLAGSDVFIDLHDMDGLIVRIIT